MSTNLQKQTKTSHSDTFNFSLSCVNVCMYVCVCVCSCHNFGRIVSKTFLKVAADATGAKVGDNF